MSDCGIDAGVDAQGCHTLSDVLSALDAGCGIEGVRCFTLAQTTVDAYGHPLDGEHGDCGQEHPKPKKRTPMSDTKAKEVKHEQEAPVPSAPALPEAVAAPVEAAKAAIAEPVTAASELVGLPQGADAGTVAMALIATAGGGAAWKFYNSFSKRKHAENMARIEREAKKQDDQHKECKAGRTALESRLAELESKLKERGDISLSGGIDADELEERLAKMEKQLKALKKREE